MQCSQEAVTSRGLNQEELSSDSSFTTDIVDSAGKIIFLKVFKRLPFAAGAEANVPCAWFSMPEPGTGVNA